MGLSPSIRLWVVLLIAVLGGCSLKRNKTAAVVPPPKPSSTVPYRPVALPEPPMAELQTRVYLPKPQPIDENAIPVVKPPEPPPAKPQPERAKPRVQPQAPAQAAPQPAVETPPPVTTEPLPRQRVRPVASESERKRLLREVTKRRLQTQRMLVELGQRTLREDQRAGLARVQAFLDQVEAALKENDLRQADALSSRALLLCQDLYRAQ